MSFNLPVFFFFRDTTINPVISFSRLKNISLGAVYLRGVASIVTLVITTCFLSQLRCAITQASADIFPAEKMLLAQ